MTYASLLEAYGYERFAADAEAAGATSLIVADLPAGEQPELRRVQLVAPTSTDERIALAAAHTDGWLYLVTVTGTTGARERLSPSLAGLAGRARRLTDLPLYAGFGISTPEQARAAAELATASSSARAPRGGRGGPAGAPRLRPLAAGGDRRDRGDNRGTMRIFSGIQPTGEQALRQPQRRLPPVRGHAGARRGASSASSTCTRSRSSTTPTTCASGRSTSRRCCSPQGSTPSARPSSARATCRRTPRPPGCSARSRASASCAG